MGDQGSSDGEDSLPSLPQLDSAFSAVLGGGAPRRSTTGSPSSFTRSLDEDAWICHVCEYHNPDLSLNRCALCGSAPSDTSSPPVDFDEIDFGAEHFIPMTDNDDPDAIQTLTSSSLMASLRETVSSVSSRLGRIAGSGEEEIEFESSDEDDENDDDDDDDDSASESLPPTNLLSMIEGMGSLLDDDQSSAPPVPAPNDIDREDVDFMDAQQDEEKTDITPPLSPLDSSHFLTDPPHPQSAEPWKVPEQSHLPDLTGTKSPKTMSDEDDNDDHDRGDSISQIQRLLRLLICCIVILIIILSILLIPSRGDDTNTGAGILVTPAPTVSSAPSASMLPSFVPTQRPSPIPTQLPTKRPSLRPSALPSSTPSMAPVTLPPTTINFEQDVMFFGSEPGARMGETVAMDESGTYAATLDGSSIVQIYHLTSEGWITLSTYILPFEAPMLDIDLILADGTPTLAIATVAYVRVLEYDFSYGGWRSRDDISWEAVDVMAPSVSLSSDGRTVATASLAQGGLELAVQVWEWSGTAWKQKGRRVTKSANSSPFLTLSLELSGNAQVFAVSDRSISVPQVQVRTYQWNGTEWEIQGITPTFLWGPSDVALTDDGECFAVATPTPGIARVYHWGLERGDWEILGGDILGGSSIAISGSGQRVLVGSPLNSVVILYDLQSNNWRSTRLFNEIVGDQFGASVAISGDGNTVVIGSPLNDSGGNNAGKVIIYS